MFGLVYTGRQPPSSQETGISDAISRGMCLPIRVLPDVQTDSLDPRSTLNYAKPYTIEHNVAQAPFGVVHPGDIELVLTQARTVLSLSPAPATPSSSTSADLQEQPTAYLRTISLVMQRLRSDAPNMSQRDAFRTAVLALRNVAEQNGNIRALNDAVQILRSRLPAEQQGNEDQDANDDDEADSNEDEDADNDDE